MSKYLKIFLFVGVFLSLESEGKSIAEHDVPPADIKAGHVNFTSGITDSCKDPLVLTNIWLIGDSTVASKSGWGDFLADFVTKVNVRNLAKGGKSSKSYYKEKANRNRWRGNKNSVVSNISAGDYVFIQFGHNDKSLESSKHTDPGVAPGYEGSYRDFLELYIKETRAAGGIPILITPVSTMRFLEDGSHNRNRGEYPATVRQVGLDHSVPVLDLESRSSKLFNALGEKETLNLFGGFSNVKDDRTHFLAIKAPGITKLVAALLKEANIPLSCHVNASAVSNREIKKVKY